METLATIGYISACVLLFSLAIAVHEFGHFIVALKLGLRVERFSLGFGPAIWRKTWRGVEYRISWIPLGGYVSIPDVDPEGTKAMEGGGDAARSEIPAWKEILVALAGPAMNVVLAAVLAVALSLVPGARFGEIGSVVGAVLPEGPAAKAGMQPGDRVLSVAGRPVSTWKELMTEIQIVGESEARFVVLRGGEEVALAIAPERDRTTGACFIMAAPQKAEGDTPGTWLPARSPLKQLSNDAGAIFRVLKALVTPKEMKATGQALIGPVNIAQGIYYSMRRDFCDGIGFLRFLNVNLAVVNLLPIPVLDGGLIMFALIALVFRRRVPEKVVNALSMAFLCLLLMFMAFLIYRDSARTWRIHKASRELAAKAAAGEEESAAEETEDADKARDKGAEGR